MKALSTPQRPSCSVTSRLQLMLSSAPRVLLTTIPPEQAALSDSAGNERKCM
jgi:hypothetical protein